MSVKAQKTWENGGYCTIFISILGISLLPALPPSPKAEGYNLCVVNSFVCPNLFLLIHWTNCDEILYMTLFSL